MHKPCLSACMSHAYQLGLRQLCFKICPLCFLAMLQNFAYYAPIMLQNIPNMPQNFCTNARRTLTMCLYSFQKRYIYACTGYLASFSSVLNVSTIASTLALALLAGCLDRSRVSRGARHSRSAAPVISFIIAEICLLCLHYARCFRVPNMPDFMLA